MALGQSISSTRLRQASETIWSRLSRRRAQPSPLTPSAEASSPARSLMLWRPSPPGRPQRRTTCTVLPVHKQVYIYGTPDPGPIELTRGSGMAWGIGGWLLFHFLAKVGPEVEARLKARVASEIRTTFASHYTRTISLLEALDPGLIAAYSRRATGEKFLINPSLAID